MQERYLGGVVLAGLMVGLSGLAWASGGGEHGAGHGELNWFDFSLRILNFGIMAAILFKLLKKPLAGFIATRRENIQSSLAELELQKQEAEQKRAEYQAKLAALDQETRKILDEYIQEGEIEKGKIIAAAQKQADYIRQQAHLAVQQEVKSAREGLQREIVELSVAAAEEVLRKNIKAKDQERLVQDFMAKVVEAK
jgi:F-type H+-transporting ATPase subunit b